ncbi:MC/SLC25 family protein [Legionella sp. W05-934-2]|uniref:MC/SLC25 family protein n=1 Tax=Legionella sp. W05-934-2 TaxID=1198649 RepID=UPI003461A226
MNVKEYYERYVRQNPFFFGLVGGSATITAVTPLLNWSNEVLEAKEKLAKQVLTTTQKPSGEFYGWRLMFKGNPFRGAFTNVMSVGPNTAIALGSKSFMAPYVPNTSRGDLFTSFVAGFFSGIVSTPFEAMFLNKKGSDGRVMPMRTVASTVVHNNGYRALMRGALAVGTREALWTVTYFSMPNLISPYLVNMGMSEKHAKSTAAFIAGGAFG